MLLTLEHAQLNLADDEIARLENAGDSRLEVTDGVVWVTVEGARDDVFLRAGESYHVNGPEPVMLSAVHGDAVLSVSSRRSSGPRAGIGRPARRSGKLRDWLTGVSLSSVAVS